MFSAHWSAIHKKFLELALLFKCCQCCETAARDSHRIFPLTPLDLSTIFNPDSAQSQTGLFQGIIYKQVFLETHSTAGYSQEVIS